MIIIIIIIIIIIMMMMMLIITITMNNNNNNNNHDIDHDNTISKIMIMMITIMTIDNDKICGSSILNLPNQIRIIHWTPRVVTMPTLSKIAAHTVVIRQPAVSPMTTKFTGDPLHSRAACTQPCNVNTHSRAHCSPGARLCEQWGHGCVNNGARLCASARLCRGSPVKLASLQLSVSSGTV